MEKIAVFDFCDTLFNGQSLDLFISFKAKDSFSQRIWLWFLRKLYSKGLLRSDIYKSLKLRVFKGMSRAKYNQLCVSFFDRVILNNLNHKIVDILSGLKKNGYYIIILSGALKDYLSFLQKTTPVDLVIANSLKFDDQICLGQIDGVECLGINKAIYLDRFFGVEKLEGRKTVFYTDHFSDILLYPLFEKVKLVINKGSLPDWARVLKLETISLQ